MDVLIVESDRSLADLVKMTVEAVLLRRKPRIMTADNPGQAAGILALPDRRFTLVICAESISNGAGQVGVKDNGTQLMEDSIDDSTDRHVIILNDPDSKESHPKFTYVPRHPSRPARTMSVLQDNLFRFYY